jgi:hypothetical protein
MAKPETKSEFLRKLLGKNPDLDYQQVNRRWAKAGHAGEISNALYYKVRGELGIKTEWAWVKEEPETRGPQEPGPERRARPNDDLVEAAQSFLPQIRMFYKRFEDKRPVMLLELPSLRIYAYSYREFKADLSERSQAVLEDEYERAVPQGKIVVFVQDDESRRLESMTFEKE